MPSVNLHRLFHSHADDLSLKIIVGNQQSLENEITCNKIQRPGLSLTGDTSRLQCGRIQVLGNSEINYINSLSNEAQTKILQKLSDINVTCYVITNNQVIPGQLLKICEQSGTPLFSTALPTGTFVNRVTLHLEDMLTPSTTIHGVMLDIFGVGILLIGKSGIGKSESALDLVLRGHRLVADDAVNIKKGPNSALYATGPEVIKYHMEIRGLGIINIKDLFGVASIRDRKIIEVVIELVEWEVSADYDRLGTDLKKYTLLDVSVPHMQIPVRPGRNITTIIEVAARNQLLKQRGHHSAQKFQEHLLEKINYNLEMLE